MRVNVVGLGYIGLPTALMIASEGIEVVGTDKKQILVSDLRNGRICSEEKGLNELFQIVVQKRISFECECVSAEIYIIAVPTPYLHNTKKLDASYVVDAVEAVCAICPSDAVIAIESTISPGTIDRYVRPVIPQGKGIRLAHVPERIIPGSILKELRENPRTIGVDDERTGNQLKELYASFCRSSIVVTDIRTAEMSKVVENTYRDVNIAFANELTKICDSAGLNVYEVIRIANMHPRVNILSPGPGVGGHCISVDPWFLVGDYPGLANLILTARRINDSMPEYVLKKIYEIMKTENIREMKHVGIYGLTYKENVNDVRESPSLQMIDHMKLHLAEELKSYDPMLKEMIAEKQVLTFDEFLSDLKLVVIMVGHQHIIENQEKLKGKVILDTKNIVSKLPVYHL